MAPRARVLPSLLLLLAWVSRSAVASKPRRPVHYPHLETDMAARRQACEGAIDAQDGPCLDTDIARENCVLRCMSVDCYARQYGEDPLEEGEVDLHRGRRFKACVLRQIMEQRAAEAGMPLEQRRVPGYKRGRV